MPPKEQRPAIGFNLQITKVTDIGGGHETVTINTACPPDTSPEAMYGKLKIMSAVLQKQIDTQRAKELARQEREREAVAPLLKRLHVEQPQGLRTPVELPDAPLENGHDPES